MLVIRSQRRFKRCRDGLFPTFQSIHRKHLAFLTVGYQQVNNPAVLYSPQHPPPAPPAGACFRLSAGRTSDRAEDGYPSLRKETQHLSVSKQSLHYRFYPAWSGDIRKEIQSSARSKQSLPNGVPAAGKMERPSAGLVKKKNGGPANHFTQSVGVIAPVDRHDHASARLSVCCCKGAVTDCAEACGHCRGAPNITKLSGLVCPEERIATTGGMK